MLFKDLINAYQGDRQIERIYLGGQILYEKELNPIVFETNFIQCTNWSIQYEPAKAYVLGQIVDPVITKPSVISGHTVTNWGVNSNISWPDAKLNLFKNSGMIDFFWEPEYSGSPNEQVIVFETFTPVIRIIHQQNGNLSVSFFDDNQALIKEIDAPHIAGGNKRVRVIFRFDSGVDNELTIKIDDEILVSDTGFSNIDRGDPNECIITKFMYCSNSGEGGRGSRLRIHAGLIPMTLDGVQMTFEGIPMFLGA